MIHAIYSSLRLNLSAGRVLRYFCTRLILIKMTNSNKKLRFRVKLTYTLRKKVDPQVGELQSQLCDILNNPLINKLRSQASFRNTVSGAIKQLSQL